MLNFRPVPQKPEFLVISHRGNISGPEPKRENTVEFVLEALRIGFQCEIDVWLCGDHWYLGHDKPDHIIPFEFLQMPGLWCHCKNLEALVELQNYRNSIISAWIDHDFFPLTSNGYIWTHTDVSMPATLNKKLSIAIMPDIHKNWNIEKSPDYCAGVCTDIPTAYHAVINKTLVPPSEL